MARPRSADSPVAPLVWASERAGPTTGDVAQPVTHCTHDALIHLHIDPRTPRTGSSVDRSVGKAQGPLLVPLPSGQHFVQHRSSTQQAMAGGVQFLVLGEDPWC